MYPNTTRRAFRPLSITRAQPFASIGRQFSSKAIATFHKRCPKGAASLYSVRCIAILCGHSQVVALTGANFDKHQQA
jgi:hypothetical protein